MNVRLLKQADYQIETEMFAYLNVDLIDATILTFTVRLQSKDELLTVTDLHV